MISGNCNRSPQYATMGPGQGAHRHGHQHQNNHYNNHHFGHLHPQQQQPHLMFMAGGSVRSFPQMSRGFSMMSGGGQGHHTVMPCNMQHGFSGGYQSGYQPQHHPAQQMIHFQVSQQQQHYIQQPYISTPPAATAPSSGFIAGIKNIVKGFIQPLNCDFYSDHHKYYNPKYRNNYMRDISGEKMSYTSSKSPEPHVQTVMLDHDLGMPKSAAATTNVPKVAVPRTSPSQVADVVAIFSSEDFPELPAPRSSRSVTPAKTEKTPEPLAMKEMPKQPSPTTESTHQQEEKPEAGSLPRPKYTFFEIQCTTRPCGRKPTFGGRLKVVPIPFSLNKSPRTCRSIRQESLEDCDTEDESFVIFQNEKPEECLMRSLGRRPPRQRQISECSDDSFVVFSKDDTECSAIASDFSDDDDDDFDSDEEEDTSSEEEEDSADDSEDDDNGTDVVDSSFFGRNKTDRNKCAATTLLNSSSAAALCTGGGCTLTGGEQPDSGFAEKKVKFNLQPVVHEMRAWQFAYRAARKGPWEDVARDRGRFQQRIERTSVYLNPILTPEHRGKIYRSRFCDDSIADQPQQAQPKQFNTRVETICAPANVSRCVDNQRLPNLTKTPQCAKF